MMGSAGYGGQRESIRSQPSSVIIHERRILCVSWWVSKMEKYQSYQPHQVRRCFHLKSAVGSRRSYIVIIRWRERSISFAAPPKDKVSLRYHTKRPILRFHKQIQCNFLLVSGYILKHEDLSKINIKKANPRIQNAAIKDMILRKNVQPSFSLFPFPY